MITQIALATLLLAPGQEEPKRDPVAPIALTYKVEYQTGREATNEQIEVMRALLLRKVHSAGASTTQPLANLQPQANFNGAYDGGLMGTSNRMLVGSSYYPTATEPPIEGAYLDGYGVVFNVTLPTTSRDPMASADGKPEPSVTDWERERRRLLGQPLPEKAPAPKRASVSDVLVKLLAENGKNFAGLKEDERVVIAVTFRGQANAATFTKAPAAVNTATDATPSFLGQFAAREDRVTSLENLGDLHLKQGQPDKAIEAYSKALEAADEAANDPKRDEPASRARVSNALVRLAQAYLAAGKVDEARATMDRAKTSREEKPRANADPKPRAANKTAQLRVPTRLTLSAPKKLLDQVGNGQMSLDDFRKKVTVEYVPSGKSE
jgi:tetratricopeptide (TPR) repeat protein